MTHYIDADKLKKIVEQAKQRALRGAEIDEDMYCDGRADAFGEVLLEIDSLQQEQPSLPSNLDDAAEEHVQTLCDRADDNLRIDTTLQAAFKAGAEWMAQQGEVLTIGTIDELCYDCHDRVPKLIEKTGLSADDRVELIVRKI